MVTRIVATWYSKPGVAMANNRDNQSDGANIDRKRSNGLSKYYILRRNCDWSMCRIWNICRTELVYALRRNSGRCTCLSVTLPQKTTPISLTCRSLRIFFSCFRVLSVNVWYLFTVCRSLISLRDSAMAVRVTGPGWQSIDEAIGEVIFRVALHCDRASLVSAAQYRLQSFRIRVEECFFFRLCPAHDGVDPSFSRALRDFLNLAFNPHRSWRRLSPGQLEAGNLRLYGAKL